LDYPFVSVVVGIRNEERNIVECIESLLNQDYPKEMYEIIIVDGMSTDNTRNLVEQYPVKLFLNEKINVAAARNIGIREARGEYIAFTDGDCKADRSWLSTLVYEMLNAPENVACVGGPNLIFDTDTLFARVVGYAQETFLGSGGSAQTNNSSKKKYVQSIPNCNAFYKKKIIEDIGYFDETFVVGQDCDLNFRIGKKGYKFLYVPEAKVYHHRRGNPRSFSIQMFRYGSWMVKLFRKHRNIVRWYAFIPAISIIIVLIGLVLSIKYIIVLRFVGFLALIYIFLISYTALKVSTKMRSIYGLNTLYILPLQHIMYGFGVLSQLIQRQKNY
jgi:glycosyltransferase involved in cell wall biosynthesis